MKILLTITILYLVCNLICSNKWFLYIIHRTIVYLIKLLSFIKIYKVHRIGYMFDELQYDDTIRHMLPYDENDETIYGKNPYSDGSWRIDSDKNRTDNLTEYDII